jgi:hypothetical protein
LLDSRHTGKKPYQKPEFRSERVFETMALAGYPAQRSYRRHLPLQRALRALLSQSFHRTGIPSANMLRKAGLAAGGPLIQIQPIPA